MLTDATQPQPQLLRVADVSRLLGVHRSTAYRLIHAGELPAVRVGQSIRVDAGELEQYVYGEPPTGAISGPENGPTTPRSGISETVPATFGDAP